MARGKTTTTTNNGTTVNETFNCNVPANLQSTCISFAPSIPDGIDVNATVEAVCVATQADIQAVLDSKIIVKKPGAFKDKRILNFNLPFTFDTASGVKVTKRVNCNGHTVQSGVSYNIMKIEETGKKDGLPHIYEKFVLAAN